MISCPPFLFVVIFNCISSFINVTVIRSGEGSKDLEYILLSKQYCAELSRMIIAIASFVNSGAISMNWSLPRQNYTRESM